MRTASIYALVLAGRIAGAEPAPDPTLRVELAGGIDVGSLSLGGIDVIANGVPIEAAASYGRLALAADYGWAGGGGNKTRPDVPWESIRRVAIDARYTFHSVWRPVAHSMPELVRRSAWLELGIGREDVKVHPG